MDEQLDERTTGLIMDGQLDGWTFGSTGQVDGWIIGRMDNWTDWWLDKTLFCESFLHLKASEWNFIFSDVYPLETGASEIMFLFSSWTKVQSEGTLRDGGGSSCSLWVSRNFSSTFKTNQSSSFPSEQEVTSLHCSPSPHHNPTRPDAGGSESRLVPCWGSAHLSAHLTPMRRAISMEQMGSAIIRSYFCIRRAEMMTPMLPRVSAMMWRRTPAEKPSSTQTTNWRKRNQNAAFTHN